MGFVCGLVKQRFNDKAVNKLAQAGLASKIADGLAVDYNKNTSNAAPNSSEACTSINQLRLCGCKTLYLALDLPKRTQTYFGTHIWALITVFSQASNIRHKFIVYKSHSE